MPTHSLDLELASTQYASVADNVALSITGDMSIEAWVNLESSPATDTEYSIATKYNSTGNQRSYAFTYLNEGGTLKLRFLTSTDGTAIVDMKVTKTLATGVWIHLAISYTASTGTATFYLNGTSQGTATGGPASIFNSTASFAIGVNGNGGFPATGSYFDGLIKHVRVFNDVRTQTEIVADARTEGITNANLAGEWLLDGSYADTSGNANTLTASGSPAFSVDIPWEAPTGIESSAYVLNLEAASLQYASIADASQTGLDLAGDHTFELWVNPESLPGSGAVVGLLAKDDLGSNRSYAVDLYNNAGSHKIRVFMSSNAGGTDYVEVTFTYQLPIGVWTHIAITTTIANAAATRSKLYINGRDEGNGSAVSGGAGAGSIFNGAASFNVGSYSNPSSYFDGLLRNVRVFNSVRTQAEILTDARAATVTSANLKGEWSFDNVYTDTSGNANTLVGSGTPVFKKWANKIAGGLEAYWALESNSNDSHNTYNGTDTAITYSSGNGKKSNGAGLASASSSKIDLPTLVNIGTITTMAFWIKTTQTALAYPIVLENAANTANLDMSINNTGGANKMGMGVWNGTTYTLMVGTTTINDGAWHHVVGVRDGANGYIYVDGKLDATSAALNTVAAGLDRAAIGYDRNGAVGFFNGSIDEISLHYRAIEYGDVLDLYNAGSAITYVGTVSVSVTGTVASATFSQPAATPNVGSTISAAALVATLSQPAASVVFGSTVSPSAATATFTAPTPDVITPDAMVTPSAVASSFSTAAPTIQYDFSFAVGVVTATFSQPAAAVELGITIAPSALTASFSTPTPSFVLESTISPSALVATFSAPTATASGNTEIAASALTATFSQPAVSISLGSVVSVSALVATLTQPTLRLAGSVWRKVSRNSTGAWARQGRNST